MIDDFVVEVSSDLDYEEMVSYISYGNHTIALISQDDGVDNMKVQLFAAFENGEPIQLPLDLLMKKILFAKNRLIEMRKIE